MSPRSLQLRKALVLNLVRLTADPNRVMWLTALVFVLFEIFLILMHILVRSIGPVAGAHTNDGTIGGFDLGDEATLAVWFSSFQLFLLALVAIGLSWLDRVGAAVSNSVRLWKAAALIFFVMSIDETAGLHEIFGKGMAYFFSNLPLTDRHWGMLPYAIAITALASCIAIRLRSELLYLSGVVAGWSIWVGSQLFDQLSPMAPAVNLILEESLEMFGATVLLLSLGLWLLQLCGSLPEKNTHASDETEPRAPR